MKNEDYQRKFQVKNKLKFDSGNSTYFGDKNSELFFRLTKKHIKDPVLDVGAGTGALIKTLQKKGFKNVKGTDLYPKVDFVKKGLITDIKFKKETFNTVLSTEVIEHLTDEQIDKGLEEINRVLMKQGKFIFSVPFNENLELNTYTCPHCSGRFHKVRHLQSFDKNRIKHLLENKGFRIVSTKVYALGAMSKLPLGRYLNWFFKRLDYKPVSKTMITVCEKK